MLSSYRRAIARHLVNYKGWRTNRKIVVIESDDWGSIRMPSASVFKSLFQSGIRVDKDMYCKYDSLASQDDLSILFETLIKHNDLHGNKPIITANTVVCNPDFNKIKENRFKNYFYEPFTKTLMTYPNHKQSFEVWKQGMNEKVFFPQFHGREHLNVRYWIESLQRGDKDLLLAFDHNVFGIPISKEKNYRGNFMAAFDYSNEEHLNEVNEIVKDGLRIFTEIFKYPSKTMMAPCYLWSESIEKEVYNLGVIGIQGMVYQFYPALNNKKKVEKRYHYQGEASKYNQKYIVRNAFFEPSHYPQINYTKEIIKRMEISFFWKKPVIISTHRLNFIGSIVEENRKTNIEKFDKLLTAMLKKWPDIEFLTSEQLVELILKQSHD